MAGTGRRPHSSHRCRPQSVDVAEMAAAGAERLDQCQPHLAVAATVPSPLNAATAAQGMPRSRNRARRTT